MESVAKRSACESRAGGVAKCQMQKLACEVYLALRCTDACAYIATGQGSLAIT